MPHPNVILQSAHLTDAVGAAVEQGRDLIDASLKTWAEEARAYLDDLAKDGAEALDGLVRCKSPFDLLVVEQNWLMARSKSWLNAGVRLFVGAIHEPESAAAELATFRLPE